MIGALGGRRCASTKPLGEPKKYGALSVKKAATSVVQAAQTKV